MNDPRLNGWGELKLSGITVQKREGEDWKEVFPQEYEVAINTGWPTYRFVKDTEVIMIIRNAEHKTINII
jgi:hypothetical protein